MACSVFPARLMSTCADPTSFHPHGSFLGLLPLSSVPVHQLLPLSKHGSLEERFPCMLRLSRESGVSAYPLGSLCSVSSSVHCQVLSGLLELYTESPWPHSPCPVQKLPFCLCQALTCPSLPHSFPRYCLAMSWFILLRAVVSVLLPAPVSWPLLPC